MKSFTQFITEAKDRYDREGTAIGGGGSSHRGGDKIGYDRKLTTPEKKRVKAIGGGKTAPAKTYKDKSDIGKTNKKRSPAGRQQQPTQKRGSASLTPKEQQKKAYLERKKRESATKDEVSGKDKNIDLKKSADKLLTKKAEKKVSSKYKPAKASGYTRGERKKLKRTGDRLLKDIAQKKEKAASHYDPKL